jgi:1-phosphofructokinase
MSPTVVVFAPSPLLTVTIEDRAGQPDIHVHAGGQGVWQARMISTFDVPVVLCAALGGEPGDVLEHLMPSEGVRLHAVRVQTRNGGYVHDRRTGEREPIAEAAGGPLDRHRLATDLAANGCRVAADLSGDRLDAVLAGEPVVLKVSHEELIADGRAESDDPADLVAAMNRLRDEGAGTVIASRAADPALALAEGTDSGVLEIRMPPLQPADPRGAGDSMTAGVVASLVRGAPMREALRTGAACGALNVVRRGLGTGGEEAVRALAERVELVGWKG